jgi:RNA polymerase sigma-70 factor (ECF subfamily)
VAVDSQRQADLDRADAEKVLAGDVAAFESIVRRWQGPLINLAWRFCRDRARAEDMAQEAFLRAYRGLPTWRGDAAFSTWLFALAVNLYRSELRRIPARPEPLRDAGNVRQSWCPEDEDRDRIVRGAVAALPAKYRDAMTLFYFHDMDVRQAALSLGLPEGTMKARLSRGRAILRRKLARLSGVQK